MRKAVFILATVLAAFLVNSNCAFFSPRNKPQAAIETPEKPAEKKPVDTKWHNYGAYLAGRTALMHADLNDAADYFMIAENDAPQDLNLTRRIAIMLAMTGRTEQAAAYAEKIHDTDRQIILNFILSTQYFKEKRYQKALNIIDEMKGDFVYNMLGAWAYAALGQKKTALKLLAPLKENEMLPIYYFQSAAVCDITGDNACANVFYQKMITDDVHIAYLPLLAMVNFYLRTDNLPKAITIVKKNALYLAQNSDLFAQIDRQLSEGKNVKPILSVNLGLSDTLLNLAGVAGKIGEQEAAETVLLLTALADYIAPEYVVPRVYYAQKLESLELWQQAVDAYAKIKPDEPFYRGAQMAIGEVLKKTKQFDKAVEVLSLFKDTYPYIYAEALHNAGKPAEAIEYFKRSFFATETNEQKNWPINLAIGICYSQLGDYVNAEEYLRKTIAEHSDAMVQNFLGYILLQQNKDIEEAFELIVSAYNSAPQEGANVDSLGWAFYKIGRYKEAEKYLETAVDLSVSEAVIYDHLGDVYWQNGRFDEAVFQWNHALALKDSSGELKRDAVLDKIKNGLPRPTALPYDAAKLESIIKSIGAATSTDNAK